MRLIPKNDRTLDILVDWINNTDMGLEMGRLSVGYPDAVLRQMLDLKYDGVANQMVVAIDEEQGKVGGFFLLDLEPQHRRVEVHHVFHPEFRTKFYLKAYDAVISYMKNELKLVSLYGIFSDSNTDKSKHLVRKGWKETGFLPKYYITHKGSEDARIYHLDLESI